MNKPAEYHWGAAPVHTASYLHALVLEEVKRCGANRILDAGCGNGQFVALLGSLGWDAVGVDGDEGGIKIARELYPDARFELGLFGDAPPGQFDMVCSTEVVEHLYAPHELARYCYDALKPGGTLVISTPYHGYLKNLALALTGGWDDHFTANWHGGHIKFWSRRTLSALLEKAGFQIDEFKGAGRYPFLWKSMILIARRPPSTPSAE
jgi:2-polyprenyl-6-hydroxyphenyl methylase/3-demethylubiquinone-9 3-methyltransferase